MYTNVKGFHCPLTFVYWVKGLGGLHCKALPLTVLGQSVALPVLNNSFSGKNETSAKTRLIDLVPPLGGGRDKMKA